MNDDRRHALYLILLGLLLFFPALGARDFWAPVEPRYAEIARVMFAKGEWIVPMVNGELYTDKPILYFWLVLIASKLVGSVNEWTVRLPAALAGVGLVLVTYRFGKDFFSPRIGFIAGAVIATSVRVIWEARWAHVDMPFTFFFAMAMYFAAQIVVLGDTGKPILPAYFFMALATLTKGLIGAVLPALSLLSYLVARGDWRLLRQGRLISGIAVFLLIAAPWFIWVSLATDGQWIKDFLFIHHLQRYTSGLGHRQPYYYYFTTLAVDFLPWTIFALPALAAFGVNKTSLKEPTTLFFILWFVAVFVFFTLSDTKRDLYLLPLFPPLAILVANYIDRLVSGVLPQGRLYQGLVLVYFNFLWVGTAALPIATWFFYRQAFLPILPGAVAMACGSLAVVYCAWRRSPWNVFLSTTFAILLGVLGMSIWVLPFADQFKSPRPVALEIVKQVPSGSPLFIYADSMHDFNFYSTREVIPIIGTDSELRRLVAENRGGYLLIKDRDLKRIKLPAEENIVVTSGKESRLWHLIALDTRNPP